MKTGIYGGTFSPVHNGHISAARAFADKLSLDRLIVIPAGIPPHKEVASGVTAEDRLNMARLAFADEARTEVSDIEIKRGGKSYTLFTLDELRTVGCDDIYLMCGSDMILTFESWYRFREVFEKCTVVYVPRDVKSHAACLAAIERYRRDYGAKIEVLDTVPYEISSTEIRAIIAAGGDAQRYMPRREYEYITERGLYKNGD